MGYDLVIIGGGPAGYVGAIRAAQLGMRVAVIERDRLGGVCLNRGCIPTKTLLTTTEILTFRRSGITLSTGVDLAKLRKRKDEIVTRLVKGIEYLFRKHRIDLIPGEGELIEPNLVKVGGREIVTSRVVVATGTRPLALPHLEFDHRSILTSNDLLDLPFIPDRLLVIGAGAVGLELATIYHRLGSRVTVVEMMDQLLPGTDPEMASLLKRILERSGLEIILNKRISEPSDIEGFDAVLVAIGRSPVLPKSRFEIDLTPNGFVKTGPGFQTNIAGIYAIGDVTGPPLLAHRASHQGMALAQSLAGGEYKLGPVPGCVFTAPEYAWIGKNESELSNPLVGKFPLRASGRAGSMEAMEGLCKVIIDPVSEQVVGAHIISPHASELIGLFSLAIRSGLKATELEHTIFPHPTLSETIPEAVAAAFKRSIHFVSQ